jgi:hypothetical protein
MRFTYLYVKKKLSVLTLLCSLRSRICDQKIRQNEILRVIKYAVVYLKNNFLTRAVYVGLSIFKNSVPILQRNKKK